MTSTVALVTGCSSGIGLACARMLTERGCTVVASTRSADPGDALRSILDGDSAAHHRRLDVRDTDSVRATFDEVLRTFGAIDVLVTNAGVGYNATVEDADLDRAAELYDTNVLGAWRCIQSVLPSMRARGSGFVAVVSSVMSSVPMLGQAAYVTSKSALRALTLCLSAETARYGVRIALIEPSVVRSKIFEKNLEIPSPTDYGWAYEYLFDFYGRALAEAQSARVVAAELAAALDDDAAYSARACGWYGEAMAERAKRLEPSNWSRLGMAPSVMAFREALEDLLGVPVRAVEA